MPIIRRQRHSPNIPGFFQIDSAVSRLPWIDIHDFGYCPFVSEKDMNPDFHAHAHCDGCQDQGTMKIHDERFAFACQRLAHTKHFDPNLKTNPRAPSRFTINRIGGHPSSTHSDGNAHGSEGQRLHLCSSLSVISNTMSYIAVMTRMPAHSLSRVIAIWRRARLLGLFLPGMTVEGDILKVRA
jgi:hypothetical protein